MSKKILLLSLFCLATVVAIVWLTFDRVVAHAASWNGRQAFARKDLPMARIQLRAAIDKYEALKDRGRARRHRHLLAQTFLLANNTNQSVEQYRAIIRDDPDDVIANQVIALDMWSSGRWRDAMPFFRSAARSPECEACDIPTALRETLAREFNSPRDAIRAELTLKSDANVFWNALPTQAVCVLATSTKLAAILVSYKVGGAHKWVALAARQLRKMGFAQDVAESIAQQILHWMQQTELVDPATELPKLCPDIDALQDAGLEEGSWSKSIADKIPFSAELQDAYLVIRVGKNIIVNFTDSQDVSNAGDVLRARLLKVSRLQARQWSYVRKNANYETFATGGIVGGAILTEKPSAQEAPTDKSSWWWPF